jgi:hypothetical protein
LVFIKFNGRKQLTFSEKTVYLLDKLEGGVLFVENEGVKRVDSNGHLSAKEKFLKLLPVIAFLRVVLCV